MTREREREREREHTQIVQHWRVSTGLSWTAKDTLGQDHASNPEKGGSQQIWGAWWHFHLSRPLCCGSHSWNLQQKLEALTNTQHHVTTRDTTQHITLQQHHRTQDTTALFPAINTPSGVHNYETVAYFLLHLLLLCKSTPVSAIPCMYRLNCLSYIMMLHFCPLHQSILPYIKAISYPFDVTKSFFLSWYIRPFTLTRISYLTNDNT